MDNCRAVYRVIELADGWHGKIIHTQVYFSKISFYWFPNMR